MTTRQSLIAAAPGLIIAAVVLITAILVLVLTSPSASASPWRATCQEDDACWNWATMGDLQRGVHVRDMPRAIHVGTRRVYSSRQWRVVSPCEFAYLAHEGLLTRKTARLRGDLFAERHGCDYGYYS